MEANNPALTVVVLTHNTCQVTLRCLSSYYAGLISASAQIIVVDNASADGTADAIAAQFPDVELVRSEINVGYSGGNNMGLRRARGHSVILLNSDVIAPADSLINMCQELHRQKNIGLLSPRLLAPDGKPQSFAFGADPSIGYMLKRGARYLLRMGSMHDWTVNHPMEVDWVSGACLCVRREALEQVGLLDERFFMYFEDNDCCLRMRQAGWKVIYDPRFEVTHLGGASQPKRRISGDIYYASMLTFYCKHYSLPAVIILQMALQGYKLLLQMRHPEN